MTQKITKTVVGRLQPTAKSVCVWDSELKGFGVRCRPSGAKYYVLKTRAPGGRQRWITIGRHGSPWTTESARIEAQKLLGVRAQGKDPAAERDEKKTAATVKALSERFLTDYVEDEKNGKKPKTAKDYRSIIERIIIPTLGHLAIADLARSDVSHLHHKLRNTPYQANRTLAVLSKMMNKAEEWDLRQDGSNPCRHVVKFKEKPRKRFLTREELKRLGDALNDAERNGAESPSFISAIRLLMFTGARLSEITTLRWEYVDVERHVISLPDSKSGAKLIPLNKPAIEILRQIPRIQNNPYVITGRKDGAHLVEMEKPWQRIRKTAKIEDVRIHDLRHSFASVAVSGGMSLPLIGKLLGHTQAQTTQRYAHLALDPLLVASNSVASSLMAAMTETSKNDDCDNH